MFVQHGGRLTAETGTMLGEMVDHLADIWSSADSGLWELGTRERYTSSKLGCWVAMARAVPVAEAGEIASRHVPRWEDERERIRGYIDDRGWSEAKQATRSSPAATSRRGGIADGPHRILRAR